VDKIAARWIVMLGMSPCDSSRAKFTMGTGSTKPCFGKAHDALSTGIPANGHDVSPLQILLHSSSVIS
jgi:hypothetical protein